MIRDENILGKVQKVWISKDSSSKRSKIIYYKFQYKCEKCTAILEARGCELDKRTGLCSSCLIKGKPSIHRKRPYESIYNQLVRTNKDRYEVLITYDNFVEIIEKSNEKCHYCDSEIKWTKHQNKILGSPKGYFLDRKDNNSGYTRENVVTCCHRCNRVKLDEFTYEEFLKIGKILKKIDKERLNE